MQSVKLSGQPSYYLVPTVFNVLVNPLEIIKKIVLILHYKKSERFVHSVIIVSGL